MFFLIEAFNTHGTADKRFGRRCFKGLTSGRHDLFVITGIITAVGEPFHQVLYQLRLVEGGGNVEALFHNTGFCVSPSRTVQPHRLYIIYRLDAGMLILVTKEM